MSLSKSEAKNALWARGELSWKLHAGQRVIDDAFSGAPGTLAVMLCQRRFGKTYWACVKAIEVALKNRKARVIIQTQFQTDITEIVKPIFDNILQDQPRSVRPTYKESKKKFVFDNGSEIVLCGLDKNPDGGRGRAVDLYVIDEAGFIKSGLKYLYESIILPMTMNQPNQKVVMISTPPRNIDHPFLEFFEKAKRENSSVKLTIYDNPMVNEATIQKFKDETLDEVTWKREYLCEVVRDETSVVIPEWDSNKYVQKTVVPLHPVHWYSGLDIGVRDKTFYFKAFYDFPTSTLHVVKESSLSGSQMTTDSIKDMIESIDEGEVFYRRVTDNSHPLLSQDLAIKHGISFVPVKKKTLPEMVNRLRVFIKNGRLKIDPRCKELILNLETASWNDKRDAFERSTTIGHADGLAQLIYCVLMLDEHTNPIPNYYGVNQSRAFIPEVPQSNQVAAIRQLFRR